MPTMTNDDPAPPDPSETLATAAPTHQTAGDPKDMTTWLTPAGRKSNPSPPRQGEPPDPKSKTQSSNSFAALAQEEEEPDATMEDSEQQDDGDKEKPDDTPMTDIEGKNLKKTAAIVEPGSAKKQRRGRSPASVAKVVTPSKKGTPQKRDSIPAKGSKQSLLPQTQATKPNAPKSSAPAKPEGHSEKSKPSGSRSRSLQPEKEVRFKLNKSKSRSKSNTPDLSTKPPDAPLAHSTSKLTPSDKVSSAGVAAGQATDSVKEPSPSPAPDPISYKDAASSADKVVKAKKKKKKHTTIQDKVDAAVAEGTSTDEGPALTTGISGIITLQATFPFPDEDSGFTDVKKAAGGLLDFLLTPADTALILYGSLGQTLSNDAITFVDLLSNLEDDEALSYLNTAGRTFSDQKQLMVKLKFQFQSGDPHSLDDLNSRCATNLQNDSVSILSCILNNKDTSPEAQKSIQSQSTQAKQLSDLTGAKVTRDEWCRYSVKIDVSMMHKYEKKKDSKDYDKYVKAHIGGAFDYLEEKLGCDLLFCRWRKTYLLSPISVKDGPFATQFSAMKSPEFKKFFNRADIHPEKKEIWCDILLAYNGSQSDVSDFCRNEFQRNKGISMYKKDLQSAEETTPIFWLLWGHNQIDPKYVQDTFKRITQVDLEIRLKKIKDGSPYGTPEEERYRKAWHVNVDTQSAHQVITKLRRVCKLETAENPLFRGQKLIPLSGEGLGDKEQEYVLKAIGRQHSFNEHSMTLTAGTIKHLDMEVDTTSGGSISLRQAIGRLNRPDEPTTRIFLAVGWKLLRGPQAAAMGKQVLFAITPDVRIDAQIMINNLLPMFRYKYGDNIARCFEPSAVAAMAELTWDPETGRVTSPSDNVIDAQETEDAALGFDLPDLAEDETEARLVDSTPANQMRSTLITGNRDHDTLGDYTAAKLGKALPRAPAKIRDDNSESTKATRHTTHTNASGSGSTLATTDTTKDKVERLVLRLRRMATKRGCWDSDDESACTTLSKLEKIDYIQGKLNTMDKDNGSNDDDSSQDDDSSEDDDSEEDDESKEGDETKDNDDKKTQSKDTSSVTYETDATMEDVENTDERPNKPQNPSSTSEEASSPKSPKATISSKAASASPKKASKRSVKSPQPAKTAEPASNKKKTSKASLPKAPKPGATKEDAFSVSESSSTSDESQGTSVNAPSESSSSLEEFDQMMEKARAKLKKTRGKGKQKGRKTTGKAKKQDNSKETKATTRSSSSKANGAKTRAKKSKSSSSRKAGAG
jgi:hypothetical protein